MYCSEITQNITTGIFSFSLLFNWNIFLDITPGYAASPKGLSQTAGSRFFLQTGCPSCHLTNSVKTLKGINIKI